MKNLKLYFLICICVGCTTLKVRETEVCLSLRGIPSIVSDLRITEHSNPKIGVVQGKIMNRIDSVPIGDVLIFSKDFHKEKEYYTTDLNGEFKFEVLTGDYDLKIRNIGDGLDQTISIKNGEMIKLEIYLGVGSSFSSYTTDNPRQLKKQIRRQNRERKRKYGI